MNRASLQKQVYWSKWIALAIIGLVVGVYIWHFNEQDVVLQPDAWGQLGDYIGGVLNPILAFGAFYWLATSVHLQQAELAETRDALEESRDAQRHQADTNLLASQVQTLNVKLARVAAKLEHLADREARVLERQGIQGPGALFYADDGAMSSTADVLKSLRTRKEPLLKEESDLLDEVKRLEKQFRKNLYPTYAN